MAGKTAVKKEKAKPVLTARVCATCGSRMMSDKVTTVLVIGFEGSAKLRPQIHWPCKGVPNQGGRPQTQCAGVILDE